MMTNPSEQFTDQRWLDFWTWFKGEKHQVQAVIELGQVIRERVPELLSEEAPWARKFSPPRPVEAVGGPFRPSSSFAHRITRNIAYGELALGVEARRFLRQHQCDTALEICQFLQKVRDHFQRPVVITSGHRPPGVNRSVGGASRSEHLFSEPDTGAVDFYVPGVSTFTVQGWCDQHWPYSVGYGAPKGFVHLGMRAGRPRVRWDY